MQPFLTAARSLRSAFAGRFFPLVALVAVLAGISLATRMVLMARADSVLPSGAGPLLKIFGIGLYFDLVAAIYLLAPFVLWLALVPDRFAATRFHRALAVFAFAAATYVLVVVSVAEWLFWEEFGARFNFIAVDYLIYTREVVGNIRESYPVGRIFALLAVPALLLTGGFARALWRHSGSPATGRERFAIAGVYAVAVLVAFRFVDSDQKDFSPSDAANELAGNGIYEFFAANYRNELNFERYYATLPPAEALAVAKAATDGPGEWLKEPAHGFERFVPASRPERRLNVVLVSIESMGAEFLGAYGAPGGLTPNLDRLAKESLWFSRVYATGNRTVRGLEALALALPPTPGQSIVRRPKNEHLFSLGSVLEDKGYDTSFAYGGYGYFDNMNAFFDRNDYRSIDRTEMPREAIVFENVWGVADESLFKFALGEIDRQQAKPPRQPFFVHIMTTSNHRPYTYPPDRIDIPSGSGRDGAVKYSDWTIGYLLREAAMHAWFDDTLFVITADHGANARGTVEIPVDKYLIPVFVYAPKHVEPRRVDRLLSQIDIAPTLLGLLGISHYSKFFGRDVLNSPPAGDRAFVANYQTLGYLKDGKLAILQPGRKVRTYTTGPDGLPAAPAKAPEIAKEAIALYQAASTIFKSGLYRDEEQLPPAKRGEAGADPEEAERAARQ